MKQGCFLNEYNDNKPVNISISFNINPKQSSVPNNQITPQQQHSFEVKNFKNNNNIDINSTKKMNKCQFQPKTPELSHTDRHSYAKEVELKRKTKLKKNQVDCNKSSQQLEKTDKVVKKHNRGESQNVRKISRLGNQKIKEKRSWSKLTDHEKNSHHNKSNTQNRQPRSIEHYILAKKEIKGKNQKNIKQLFNKFIKNELSRRSLSIWNGINGKYFNINYNSKRKSYKKKSNRPINKTEVLKVSNRKQIVEKLPSLRSMNNSILKSQMMEQLQDYYQYKNEKIIILTDQSQEYIKQIYAFQKSSKKQQPKQQFNDEQAIQQTYNLIQTYVAHLNKELGQQSSSQFNNSGSSEKLIANQSLRYMMEHKYGQQQQQQQLQQQQQINNYSSLELKQPYIEHEQVNFKKIDEQNHDQIRPFISSEMKKQQSIINSNQRFKLTEMKKQQVEKWSYLLDYIKTNIDKNGVDTQQLLGSVYKFLEKTKLDLQKDVKDKNSIPQMQKFTVNFLNKQEILVDQIDTIFKDDESFEENTNLKFMNLQTIENALKNRHNSILIKKNKEIAVLEQRRQLDIINDIQMYDEKQKIQKWFQNQSQQIIKANKNIWKGYSQAKSILDKSANSQYFEQCEKSERKMMKCLSDNYLIRKSEVSKTFLKKIQPSNEIEKEFNTKNRAEVEHSESSNQQNNFVQQDEMNKIKQRLLSMKQKHFQIEQQNIQISPNVSYQQIQKQLSEQYQDEQLKIIQNEIKNNNNNIQNNNNNIYKIYKNNNNNKIQNINSKLKYIDLTDKQDIFEFLFLDLCVELYQQPCQENKIMKNINQYINKIKYYKKIKKGVKTNINSIKQYLKRFYSFLLRTNKKFMNNLRTPVGPTAQQMLKFNQDNQDQNINKNDQNAVTVSTIIIPMESFQQYETNLLPSIEFNKFFQDQQKEQQRTQFLRNILHIHNNALFDSLNETLDLQRPFGIWGKPFPWKNSSNFMHIFTELQCEQKLSRSCDQVIQNCSFVCGLLVDKQQSLVQNVQLSDAYIEQIKQDRLARMLARQLIDNEQKWLFYDDEQVEVLLQISKIITQMLLIEIQKDLNIFFI